MHGDQTWLVNRGLLLYTYNAEGRLTSYHIGRLGVLFQMRERERERESQRNVHVHVHYSGEQV